MSSMASLSLEPCKLCQARRSSASRMPGHQCRAQAFQGAIQAAGCSDRRGLLAAGAALTLLGSLPRRAGAADGLSEYKPDAQKTPARPLRRAHGRAVPVAKGRDGSCAQALRSGVIKVKDGYSFSLPPCARPLCLLLDCKKQPLSRDRGQPGRSRRSPTSRAATSGALCAGAWALLHSTRASAHADVHAACRGVTSPGRRRPLQTRRKARRRRASNPTSHATACCPCAGAEQGLPRAAAGHAPAQADQQGQRDAGADRLARLRAGLCRALHHGCAWARARSSGACARALSSLWHATCGCCHSCMELPWSIQHWPLCGSSTRVWHIEVPSDRVPRVQAWEAWTRRRSCLRRRRASRGAPSTRVPASLCSAAWALARCCLADAADRKAPGQLGDAAGASADCLTRVGMR